jgi:hypothetical protein
MSQASLIALLAVSALGLGAVHSPVLLACVPLAMLASFQAVGTIGIPRPAWLFIGLSVWSLVQAVPLPFGLLEILSSHSADIWARSLAPFGEPAPRFASLSADPGASVLEALKWTLYAMTFVAAAHVGASRGSRWTSRAVFGVALLLAFVTLGHVVFDAKRVYGFYEPLYARAGWRVGPFVNANNLAGYLNLGIIVGLGMVLSSGARYRGPIALALFLMIAVEVLTGSRGGQVALAFGTLVTGFIAALRVARRGGRKLRLGRYSFRVGPRAVAIGTVSGLVVLVALGVGLATLGARPATWAELGERDLTKLQLAGASVPVIRDHPLWGVGRGAFETVFPAYRVSGRVIYTHPENFVAQWLVEWGVPVALITLLALAWCFRPSRLKFSGIGGIAAYVAVLVLLFQNLVDLSLEVPAVVFAAVTMLGGLYGAANAARADAKPVLVRSLMASGGVTAVACAFLLVGFDTPDAARREVHRHYAGLDPKNESERRAFFVKLRESMRAHPGDPYFPRLGGMVAYRSGDNPMPWIQRALERGPTYGRTHYLLALVLARAKARNQALFELKLAVTYDEVLREPAASQAVRWSRSFDELLRAVPDDGPGARQLLAMTRLLKDPELRLLCFEEAVRRDGRLVDARVGLIRGAIDTVAQGTKCPLRHDEDCARAAEQNTKALADTEPSSTRALELEARILSARGRTDEAQALLARRCVEFVNRRDCLRLRVELATAEKKHGLDEAATALYEFDCLQSADRCAETATWLGDIEVRRMRWFAAATFYERAARERPTKVRLERLATTAERAGLAALAANARSRLADAR